ncbi:type II toxin-antitoxin system Phd/YefM family antitoxin [Acidicapsa ligni]|uniref:type II toxin-antitoxin system Phd/YefM family antitoxin n=1 Tax=Acidicapsa ligni TaxID=542300 RepID=UPI0021DF9601|nr:type II toxin-antitoxin system prevent-host-death family antitoxin [Acidicapsa ligni]
MAYTVHQAKTHFSRLLKEVEEGKEVIVMRGSKPVAKLVPIVDPPQDRRRLAGGYEGLIHFENSAFNPLTDEQMIEYGFDNPAKDELFKKLAEAKSPSPEPAE